MLKLEIVMNEEKIRKESDYDINEILNTLDSTFSQYNLPCKEKQQNKRVYVSNSSEKDFANFWSIILKLEEEKWFTQNIKKWFWYNSNGSSDPRDFVVEDLIQELIA